MYLHIIPDEKFTKSYIRFMNNNFDQSENLFVLTNSISTETEEQYNALDNVECHGTGFRTSWKLFKYILKSEKVIIHNLAYINPKLMLLLGIAARFKKIYWVIWGQDLYCYRDLKISLKEKLSEQIRKFLIRGLYGIIFHVRGDYELAKKWYGTRARYFAGGYSMDKNVYENILTNYKKRSDEFVRIQIGNSAAKNNNHIKTMEKIASFGFEKLKIYCPLSYPNNPEYKKAVVEKGKELFGDNFVPLLEMMPYNDYMNYLASIDIGVFPANRQQGLGNISALLHLGAKVYINDDTTMWDYYIERGAKVFAFNKLDDNREEFIKLLSKEVAEHNIQNMRNTYPDNVKNWSIILKS